YGGEEGVNNRVGADTLFHSEIVILLEPVEQGLLIEPVKRVDDLIGQTYEAIDTMDCLPDNRGEELGGRVEGGAVFFCHLPAHLEGKILVLAVSRVFHVHKSRLLKYISANNHK